MAAAAKSYYTYGKATAETPDRNDVNDMTSEEGDQEPVEDVEAYFVPSEGEKNSLLNSFDAMRKESLFCDVAFICNGVLFRAHRVIVSSWSRWMRTFLCDSPEEEVLSLDIFSPEAFRSVLDYMYGQPLHLTVETADAVIKVARRLELPKLEQHCWRYLMTALDEKSNCEYLHDLADRYDCPPLKLAAWKMIQNKIPGLSHFPSKNYERNKGNIPSDQQSAVNGLGFITPGDPAFNPLISSKRTNLILRNIHSNTHREQNNFRPSVFDDFSGNNEEYDEEREQYLPHGRIPPIDQLKPDAGAVEVIMAWSQRLKEVYAKCAPLDAMDEDTERLKISENSPNIKLTKVMRIGNNNTTNKSNKMPGTPTSTTSNNAGGVYSPNVMRPAVNNQTKHHHQQQQQQQHPPAPRGNNSPKISHQPDFSQQQYKRYNNPRDIQWAEELEIFYTAVGLPEKVAGIKQILKTWYGKEDQMVQSLVTKYEKNIPPSLMKHLEELQGLMETQTEASFNNRRGY